MNKSQLFLSVVIIIVILFSTSCENKNNNLAFYHWKNDTNLTQLETDYLQKLKVKQIYMRFFDIGLNDNDKAYPISVIREIDQGFDTYEIIPVVYITNETFVKTDDVAPLVEKVHQLIDQMYEHHFGKNPMKIQIDCDWTNSTREKYFNFLTQLKPHYSLSATIRLHQIKYQNRTGVPPVDEGSLMVYNIGDLKDTTSNSILSQAVLEQYINPSSSYPLPLDKALPLYSWGILQFPDGSVKLLNNFSHDNIISNLSSYRQINDAAYEVIKPCALQSYFLPIGTILKIENISFEAILKAKNHLELCNNIDWRNTLLYHLDEEVLESFSIDDLEKMN